MRVGRGADPDLNHFCIYHSCKHAAGSASNARELSTLTPEEGFGKLSEEECILLPAPSVAITITDSSISASPRGPNPCL